MVNLMKSKYYYGIVCGLLVFIMISSCKTPPEPPPPPEPSPPKEIRVVEEKLVPNPPDTLVPLTTSILRRLTDDNFQENRNIGKFQLLLFGRIILEREYTDEKEPLFEGGKTRFEDVHTRKIIIFNDQTEGQALRIIENERDRITLFVCFEQKDEFQLSFSKMTEAPDEYFYLDFQPSADSASSEEKGMLFYGDEKEPYKLKFTGDKIPHLLIKLSLLDKDIMDSRIAPGRKVN
jgi:hypothetical protein